MILPPARKLSTHLIPAHNSRALQDPKDDPNQSLWGLDCPPQPHTAAPTSSRGTQACTEAGGDHTYLGSLCSLLKSGHCWSRPQQAFHSSQLHNHCVQGKKGNQIQTQKGKTSGNQLDACP